MTFTTRRAAAAAAAAALVLTGLPGVAAAQTDGGTGSLNGESLGDLSSGSATGNGSENLGSIILDADATGNGSVDTSGSTLLDEPSTGSLAPLAGSAANAFGSIDPLTPAPGTGSVDTAGSIIGEPTTGSLAPLYAPIVGSLGIGDGATLVIGDTGSLAPAVLGLGSVAAIGAGIYFAPQIQQALQDAGIALPPLPGQPLVAPAPAPAPGPDAPNGRG